MADARLAMQLLAQQDNALSRPTAAVQPARYISGDKDANGRFSVVLPDGSQLQVLSTANSETATNRPTNVLGGGLAIARPASL